MTIVKITADVYSSADDAVYRLYVDDHLMTERTIKWPHRKYYIEEQVVIKADPGTTHTIRVESVKEPNSFTLRNITVNGASADETFIV
jgi:hypothetical protein